MTKHKKPSGWFGESHRHSLAQKRVSTSVKRVVPHKLKVNFNRGTMFASGKNIGKSVVVGDVRLSIVKEGGEFIVKYYKNGRLDEGKTYYADDFMDAVKTRDEIAQWVKFGAKGLSAEEKKRFDEFYADERKAVKEYSDMAKKYPDSGGVFMGMARDENRHSVLVKDVEQREIAKPEKKHS